MTTSVQSGIQNPYIRYPYMPADNQLAYQPSVTVPQEYVTAPVQQAAQDEFVPSTQEQVQNPNGCTDGNDDGHISFWSKVGNTVKGVGKAIVGGIKGMFTNKEGKFSLGKTLLSVGVIAASIAFPAVGLALCAVGAVAGGAQIVKGGIKASKAKTDAEAKEAWQNIGAGTFQVAASVAGAKASLGAMKATSTATNGLASLSKDATLGQKASALLADAKSSTVNRFNTITNQAKTLVTRAEITKAFKDDTAKVQAQELADAKARVEGFETSGDSAITEYRNAAREVEVREAYLGKARGEAAQIQAQELADAQARLQGLETSGNPAVREYQNALRELEIRETYSQHGLKADFSLLKGKARTTISNAMDKLRNANFRKNFNVSSLSTKAQQAYQVLTTEGYSQAVTKCGYQTVTELLSVIEAVDIETTK